MFLKEFPVEKKRLILDLGIYASMSDQVMTDDEKAVVDNFCKEMEFKANYEPVSSLDATIFAIRRNFTDDEKRKIFFEIVSIVASDVVTEREEKFILNLKKEFEISDEKYETALAVAKDFVRVSKQIEEYLA